MGFTVYPPAVGDCAVLLGADGDDVRAARRYVRSHGSMSWHDGGLIHNLSGAHEALMNDLNTRLSALANLLDSSHHGLREAARLYADIDARTAATLDATYDGAPPRWEANTDRYPQSLAVAPSQPSAAMLLLILTEPDPSWSGGFVDPLGLFNYVSPTAWANAAIESLTGTDVIGWVTATIGGDWAAIWRFGDALDHLASFMGCLGANIASAANAVDPWWDGHAADGAQMYLRQLASAVSAHEPVLRAIAGDYHDVARGAWLLAADLGNIAQALADWAIAAGVSAAAGTALAETGAGAVIGYALAALIVTKMVTKIAEASTIITTFGTMITTVFGAGKDFSGLGGQLTTLVLPAHGYHHPGVRP